MNTIRVMSRTAIQFQKGRSVPEFKRHYGTEERCEVVLNKARWAMGFHCAHVNGHEHGLDYCRRLKRYQ